MGVSLIVLGVVDEEELRPSPPGEFGRTDPSGPTQLTSRSSTSKMRTAFGGITSPAP